MALIGDMKLTMEATALPNYQGCADAVSQSFPYCDTSLSVDERVAALIDELTLDEKISRMYSCVDDCDTSTG